MTEPNIWPPPIRYPDSVSVLETLTWRQRMRLRYRWVYTLVAPLMAFITLDQYSRHDPWCWMGLLATVLNSGQAVVAWRLKWRLDREGKGAHG